MTGPGSIEVPADAEECFIWWGRKARSQVGIDTQGLNLEEAETLLLMLAADLHQKRTGERCAAVIVP